MLGALPRPLAELIGGAGAAPVLMGEAGASVMRLTRNDGFAAYLKSGQGSVADDIVDEAIRLRWLQGRVPCAPLLYFACEGDAAWLLTGAVAGRTGDEWLEAEPARRDLVIDGCADFLRRLHRLSVADCPFEAGAPLRMAAAARRVAAGAVDTEDFDDDHAGWSAERLWEKLVALVPPPGERVVTHGDFSLGNLLLDETGVATGVIDVGRLGVADPYQDVAILWQNLGEFGEGAQRRLLAAIDREPVDRQRLEFHRCLDEFF